MEILLDNKEKLRVEIQFGLTGTNDIKQRKVIEAKRVFQNSGVHSLAIHFDLFNKQVAFVKLDEIKDDDEHWLTRIYTGEGLLFNIDQNYFVWDLNNTPPAYQNIIENYYA